MGIPERKNTLALKLEPVEIPVQSLSSGGFVLVPRGTFPEGASIKVRVLSTILKFPLTLVTNSPEG